MWVWARCWFCLWCLFRLWNDGKEHSVKTRSLKSFKCFFRYKCVTTVFLYANPMNSPVRSTWLLEVVSLSRVVMQVNWKGPCELSYTATRSSELLVLPVSRGGLTCHAKPTPSTAEEHFSHTIRDPSTSPEKTSFVVGSGRGSAGVHISISC